MKLQEVFNEALKIIKPEKTYLKRQLTEAQNIITQLKKKGLTAKIGGSLAKGTLIKTEEKPDVDIFIIYDNEKKLSTFLTKILNIKFEGKRTIVHGSRDYYQIEGKEAIYELIPVMKLKPMSKAGNVTDFSLKHVTYIKQELTKKPRLIDDILLAKAFCKAQGIYGAESYKKGFSGYSLEVLLLHYGGIENFMKKIMKETIIDPKKQYLNKTVILREINESKLHSPIIVVDPTYKYRNITAGLGKETFEKALRIFKEFLKNPGLDYFTKRPFNKEELEYYTQQHQATMITLHLMTDRQEGDIAGTKMKKVLDYVSRELARKQQFILNKTYTYEGKGNQAKGYLIIKEKKILDIKGPSIGLEEASKKFKQARKGIYMKNKYLWAKESFNLENYLTLLNKQSKDMGATFTYKLT